MDSTENPQTGGAQTIFIIRHGEKPVGSAEGVTIDGAPNEHSLIPRGWQRAGALVNLFAPQVGPIRPGLATPKLLIAPFYEDKPKDPATDRRTHQTITPLAEEIGLKVEAPYPEEQEHTLGKFVSTQTTAPVVLICWEHGRIPKIGEGIVGVTNRESIPKAWPEGRFDLIWRFQREASGYYFSIFPELLLPKDSHPPDV